MRVGFFMPWWLFPFYVLAWICFLPVWIVLAIFRAMAERRQRQRDMVRVTISIRDHEKSPAPAEAETGR